MRSFYLYIDALIDRYIYLIPVFMLFATLVTNFVDYVALSSYNYIVVGNSVGCSLATNLVFYYLFNKTKKRYCWFTRTTPKYLAFINIIDIIGDRLDVKTYCYIFNISICLIIIILASRNYIKKRLAHD